METELNVFIEPKSVAVIGASERPGSLGRTLLASNEVDALILHGLGRPGFIREGTSPVRKIFLEAEKQVMRGYGGLQQEMGRPVILGCCLSSWESQAVSDLQREGIRFFHRPDEIAQALFRMYEYWRKAPRS